MKKLLIYLKPYRKEAILAPLFKMFEAILELLVPLVMAAIIDVGIPEGDNAFVWRMIGVLVLLGAVGLAAAMTAQYFSAKAAVGFAAGVRNALFSHLQSLSYKEIDRLGTSTMITRMTGDVNLLQTGVNLTLRLLLRSPFVVVGAMIMAFVVDPVSALIFVAVIPLLCFVVWLIMRITLPKYKGVQQRVDGVVLKTRENLSGVRVIRAFNKEEAEQREFGEKNEELTRFQCFVGRISALMNPLTYVIVNLGIVALIYVGALRVDGGLITQGMVVALINYMSQILVELVKFANLVVTVTKALAGAKRVSDVFALSSSQTSGDRTEGEGGDEILRFEEVGIRYYSDADPALSQISFTVKQGQTVGILGGTGSGKSTLVNLIPRFYDATEGTVFYRGADIRSYDAECLRSRMGIVPQKAVLFRGTVRENLKWGREDASDEDLWEALRIAQGEAFVRDKALGLDEPVEQNGRNFSGGQRQRLTVARALVRRPEILILDDSASALDYATEAALRNGLKNLPFECTTFIVSQRASSVRHADLIIVLEDGCAVGMGTHEELITSCEVYREIYYSQFEKEDASV
ncbi:MAG: ABC transporter ATP-binding protein [Clostridia bacterium]|nr:ABC transporter ATP-binding protein [Clostridia bacterium]